MDPVTAALAPHAVRRYTALNRRNIPPSLDRHYRPADYVNVGVDFKVVFWLPWQRGREAQNLLIPYGEDWLLAQKYGTELVSQANSQIASRNLAPILLPLPAQLRRQAQCTGIVITLWDALKLGSELHRMAGLFANGGRAHPLAGN